MNLARHCRFLFATAFLTPLSSADFSGPIDQTNHFRITHFHVSGAVCGGLGADLGVGAAELVPAPAIEAEVRERVGCCVEGHGRICLGGAWRVGGEGGLVVEEEGSCGNGFLRGGEVRWGYNIAEELWIG